MNYAQIVEICCRDLRRYLDYTLKVSRGGVVSVKMKNLLRVELSPPDRARYSKCLSRILHAYRWNDTYVIPRQDVEKILESFDELCQSARQAKRRSELQPRRRQTPKEETVLIAVSLPNDLLRAVDEYARQLGVTRSAVIRIAIQDLIDMRRALEEINKAKNGPLGRVALRLPTDLLNELNKYAATLKAPRSALVRYAIHKLIEKIKDRTTLTQTP
jgi:metal-responsive CopG/Arc/MetJ family transcriptional regulator